MIAKYRKAEFPGEWWLTDFTMEQVEGRISGLEAELAQAKDFRGGTIHNSWLTAPREKLIEALRFQGAITKEYMKKTDDLRAENIRLRKAIKKHRNNIWGDREVGHDEDIALYEALEKKC